MYIEVHSILIVVIALILKQETLYSHYPQYKDDIEFNIRLTYSINGGYYAYNQYCKCGDERVTGIIGEISERVMKQD